MTWVFDYSPAKAGDRLVLLSLANHAHADGSHAHPTVETLAGESVMSTRSVGYALHSLEHGFEGSGRAIRRDGVGPNRAVMWTVLMDDQARTFRGVPRQHRGANIAPPDAAHIAPSPLQNGTAEGAICDSRGINRQEPSREPSHPLTPSSSDAQLGPVLRPVPELGHRREVARIEAARRADLEAWLVEHPATAELQALLVPVFDALRARVEDSSFSIWISPLHVHQAIEQGVVLGTSDQLVGWTEQRYGAVLAELLGRPVRVIECGCPPAAIAMERAA